MDHSTQKSTSGFNTSMETWELESLARYLSGECSPDESERVCAWIESDPERTKMVAGMQQVWSQASTSGLQWDTARVWDAIQARRRLEDKPVPGRNVRNPGRMFFGGAVLSAIALLAIGTFVLNKDSGYSNVRANLREPASERVFATQRGQQSIVRLPDGAEVILAPDSRLHVSNTYGESGRNVYLEGTAQFSVKHDPKSPFVVHTEFGQTRDLATVFVVTAYRSDTAQRVAVSEGVVEVVGNKGEHAPGILNPGDLGVLNQNGILAVQNNVDISVYTSWTNGELRFVETPLKDIVAELERWYDVNIKISDQSIAAIPLTVSVGRGTIEDAINLIGKILGIKPVQHGSEISLIKESVK